MIVRGGHGPIREGEFHKRWAIARKRAKEFWDMVTGAFVNAHLPHARPARH
jgi:hypothetical protein